jgi:hypothetical protein
MPVLLQHKPTMPAMRTDDLAAFIRERHRIYHRKELDKPKPWTDDPILLGNKFCNCYRELDTVTKWIAEHWREPHSDHPHIWFAMCVARWINWPDSLEEIGFPLPWRPQSVVGVLKDRAARGEKVWTGAYTIGTGGRAINKAEFVVKQVLDPLWRNREWLQPRVDDTLASFARRLIEQVGFSGFMTGQVVADVRYVQPLRGASDWQTWAAAGPGSSRGLNRVLNRNKDTRWDESDWLHKLHLLQEAIQPLLRRAPFMAKIRPMHAQDLQNCLCEFDKYERVRLGEGKLRSRYPGRPSSNGRNGRRR